MGFILNTTARLANATLGGPGRRMALGVGVGGLYGGLASDNNSSTGLFKDVVLGATTGFGIGAATTRFARRAASSLIKPTARVGWTGAVFGGKIASNVTSFAFSNPRTALALGAAGVGAYTLATSSPGSSGMNIDAMSRISQQSGSPSTGFMPGMGATTRQGSRNMFMESTFGLTQGLHSRRHS